MIEVALNTVLRTNPGVSALAGDRIYPLTLPQNAAYPAITYQRMAGSRIHSHQGASGLAMPTFLVSCWGSSYLQAKQVAVKVVQAFARAPGQVGDVMIQAAFAEEAADAYEAGPKVYNCPVEVVLHHNE